MRRNDDRYYDGGMSVIGSFIMGAVIGAAAIFFSDERNRKRVRSTMDDWKNKAEEAKDNLQEKAEDLREEGLRRVSDELSKTEKKVNGQRREARA